MDTKNKIIQVAILALHKNEGATLEEIAKAAGLSRRTLHRHFLSREDLIEACNKHMLTIWKTAVIDVYNKGLQPLILLEELLNIAIDLGHKFSFLTKYRYSGAVHPTLATKVNEAYQHAISDLFKAIATLQAEKIIDPNLPLVWIRLQFIQSVATATAAKNSGDIAPNQINQLAWLSFKRSLGIH